MNMIVMIKSYYNAINVCIQNALFAMLGIKLFVRSLLVYLWCILFEWLDFYSGLDNVAFLKAVLSIMQ